MRFISRILLSLSLVVAAAAAWAGETGSISGTVKDSNGLGVPGATVRVSGALLPGGRQAVTSSAGAYNFQRLQPGTYRVEAELAGLGKAVKQVSVLVDEDNQVTLSLVKSTATEVTVTAEAVSVDLKSSEVVNNFTDTEIKALPLARTYQGLLQLIPGAADTTGLTYVGVSVAGGTLQDNKYMVDGVNITNPGYGALVVQTNELDISDFSVKRTGISAESGRTIGALVNAVTKSGTNELHGGVRFEALPDSFIAAPSTGLTVTQKVDRYTGSGNFGFPIFKDVLFGYVSARYFSQTASGQSGAFGTQPDTQQKNQDYFGKLTGNFGTSLLLNASLRALPTKQTNAFDSLNDAPTAGYDSDVTNYVGNATASYFLSSNSFLEAKYIHLTETDTSQAQNVLTAQPTTIDPAHLANYGKFVDSTHANGNAGFPEFANTGDDFKRDEIKVTANQYFDLGSTQHQLKVGGGYENDAYDLVRQTNGWGLFATGTTCPVAACGLAPPANTGLIRARFYTLQPEQFSKGRTYSVFLQDTVTWGRLSATAGVLFNEDDFAQVAQDGTRFNFMTFGWGDEIQPRLGLVYNTELVNGDKVYFNFGRYIGLDQKSNARANAPFRIRQDEAYFDPTTGAFLGQNVRGSSAGKRIATGLKPPYSDDFALGYAAPVGKDVTVEAYYQYRSQHDIFEDLPIDPNNFNGSFQVNKIPGASRTYRAITLDVNKRFSNRWMGSLNYTYSRLRGNFDLDQTNGTSLFNTSSIIEDGPGVNSAEPNRYGYLTQDRPHILKLFASYELPFGLSVGGYYRYQSGLAWQAQGVDAVSGIALRYLEPAGSRRLPGWSNFDFLLAYGFKLGGDIGLRLEARVLDVFDTQTGLTVNKQQYLDAYVNGVPPSTLGPQGTTKLNPSFGTFTSYAQPRRLFLSGILEF